MRAFDVLRYHWLRRRLPRGRGRRRRAAGPWARRRGHLRPRGVIATVADGSERSAAIALVQGFEHQRGRGQVPGPATPSAPVGLGWTRHVDHRDRTDRDRDLRTSGPRRVPCCGREGREFPSRQRHAHSLGWPSASAVTSAECVDRRPYDHVREGPRSYE